MPEARRKHSLSTANGLGPQGVVSPCAFQSGYADFCTASGNASTLPRSAGESHFEALRKLCGT
jgi:hypothetical protein